MTSISHYMLPGLRVFRKNTLAFDCSGTAASSSSGNSSSSDSLSSSSVFVSSEAKEDSESESFFFDFPLDLVVCLLGRGLEGRVCCTASRVDLRVLGTGATLDSSNMSDIKFAMRLKTQLVICGILPTPWNTSSTRSSGRFATSLIIFATEVVWGSHIGFLYKKIWCWSKR